tara:strand:- start:3865 stop:4614 length:750 start_codon:yes stop_codon:yes gene_type:complete
MARAFRIGIVGDGNAGNYFANQFVKEGLEVSHFSRNPKSARLAVEEYSEELNLDFLFLAIPDGEISGFSKTISSGRTVIIHLSGTTELSAIDEKHKNKAVFWPLMSLSPHSISELKDIPFCLEANTENARNLLQNFCDQLNLQFYWRGYEQRLKMHLAAVISQNFSNHLFHISHNILKEEDLDMELFKPILLETINRLGKEDPKIYQTGPAKRKDHKTIERHLDLLKGSEKEIYSIISQSIQEENEGKL